MKCRVNAILIGAALALTTVSASQAMSSLVSLSVEPEWPATPNPGRLVVYKVTAVVRAGSGLLEVALSSLGLPQGSLVEFYPSVFRFTGHDPTNQTAIMTVTCPVPTATDNYPFTVTGTAQRESITLTNQVQQQPLSPMVGRPVLLLDRLSAGEVRLRGKGATGQYYIIQSTPSLTDPAWTSIGSSTADGNGRFSFAPSIIPDAPARFYRAVESVQ